ncbi:MAG: hypothetical protein ACJ74W_01365 [Pyrinomonadaceae bacterium]
MPTNRKPQAKDGPRIAGRSRVCMTNKRGLPYTRAEVDAQVAWAEWSKTRAALLVAAIMPESGMLMDMNPDEVGAALMEIITVLTYMRSLDDRENLHTDLATLVFAHTDTHMQETCAFYRRRLVFPA